MAGGTLLTNDGQFDTTDLNVFGQMMNLQGSGGGGCDEWDPFCQLQRVVEIAYDYRNQMVQYQDLDQLRTHRYHYDCFGRRVAKVVDHGSGYAVTTRFVYGGQASWQVLAEYDGFQPGSTQPASATYIFGNYIDEPVRLRKDFDPHTSGDVYDFFYHPDELFNIVAITAGQADTELPSNPTNPFALGAVVERYQYGDYGNPLVTDASGSLQGYSSVFNRFAFTGREYDEELGWSYYRTRYLNHAWGRFTTRDPIGLWGDEWNNGNPSSYVGDSPAHGRDPFGLKTFGVPVYHRVHPDSPHPVYRFYYDRYEDNSGFYLWPWNWQDKGYEYKGREDFGEFDLSDEADRTRLEKLLADAGVIDNGVNSIKEALKDFYGPAAVVVAVVGIKCGFGGGSGAGRVANPTKAESPVWKALKNYRGGIKTNGKTGRHKRYYVWDHTHNDIEEYGPDLLHRGTIDPVTGLQIKPAVPGRDIRLSGF